MYNTGNLIKSNNKSFLLVRLSMAISSKFIVSRKLAIIQLAPTKIPAPKLNLRIAAQTKTVIAIKNIFTFTDFLISSCILNI